MQKSKIRLATLIVWVFSCTNIIAQLNYTYQTLTKGGIQMENRWRPTNSAATSRLPIYGVINNNKLLRIEPHANYHTQLFDEKFNLLWEINTSAVKDFWGINFVSHAAILLHSKNTIYQIDYAYGWGKAIIKRIDINTGQFTEKECNSKNLGNGYVPRNGAIISDEKIYYIKNRKKEYFLACIDQDLNYTEQKIELSKDDFEFIKTWEEGYWALEGLDNNSTLYASELHEDLYEGVLRYNSAEISVNGKVEMNEKTVIDYEKRTIIAFKKRTMVENSTPATYFIAVTKPKGDAANIEDVELSIKKVVKGRISDAIVYPLTELLTSTSIAKISYDPRSLINNLIEENGTLYFDLNFIGLTISLHINNDFELEILQTDELEDQENTMVGTFRNMGTYEFDTENTYNHSYPNKEALHEYLNKQHPMPGKSCQYQSLKFNNQYILVRDDIIKVSTDIFLLNE